MTLHNYVLDPVHVIVGLFLVFLSSIVVTECVRRYALKHSVIDEPNERSSHSVSTATGGGLSIGLSFLIAIVLLAVYSLLPVNLAVALGGGALLVSLTGWLDDHRNIATMWRVILYLLAAVWAVFWAGGLDSISLGIYELPLPYIGNVLAVLWISWLTNLYNFMDGTDGLAGVQATTTAFLSGILFWLSAQHGLALICFVLLAASSGFLVWNWPPAKIFMGDVGSCLLGFSFGTLALIGEKTGSVPALIWLIMLAVFVCDATLTLIRRIVLRERWYAAHKSHAYQRYVQMGASHKKLALSVLFINIGILWPLACVASLQKSLSIYMTLLAIIIVAAIWTVIQRRYIGSKISGE